MTELQEPQVVDPQRVRNFAMFFKSYMSIATIVVAALPIPVTHFELIPFFTVHKDILTFLTPVFCFLTLGFLFFLRHSLAKVMFPAQTLFSADMSVQGGAAAPGSVPDRSSNSYLRLLNSTRHLFIIILGTLTPLALMIGSAYLLYIYISDISTSLSILFSTNLLL